MSLLEKAIELAVRAHAGQTDEDGMPHIVHCLEVMLSTKRALEIGGVFNHEFAQRLGFKVGNWDAPGAEQLSAELVNDLMIAAVLHDTCQRLVQVSDVDPDHRAGVRGGRTFPHPLADQAGGLEVLVGMFGPPAEDGLVERGGPGGVDGRHLQVADLPVNEAAGPAGLGVFLGHGGSVLCRCRGSDRAALDHG